MISGLDYDEWTRSAVDFRLIVNPMDRYDWDAFIPTNMPPSFAHRTVVFKGPARSFWLADNRRFHDNVRETELCTTTFNANANVDIEHAKDPTRHFAYWMLVLPKNIVFDNRIFSRDTHEIDPGFTGLMVTEKQTGDLGKKLYGLAITWRIGLQGGTQNRDSNAEKPKSKDIYYGK